MQGPYDSRGEKVDAVSTYDVFGSHNGLFRDLHPILILAIGLVIFTVAGTGLLIGWLIPALPTAVAAAARNTIEIERRLRLAALRTERDELHRLNMGRKLDDTSYRRLTRQIDLMEAAASRPQES